MVLDKIDFAEVDVAVAQARGVVGRVHVDDAIAICAYTHVGFLRVRHKISNRPIAIFKQEIINTFKVLARGTVFR